MQEAFQYTPSIHDVSSGDEDTLCISFGQGLRHTGRLCKVVMWLSPVSASPIDLPGSAEAAR
jgi:hypothetical protein